MNPILKGALIGGLTVFIGIVAAEIAKDYSLGDWLKDHVLSRLHGVEVAALMARDRAESRLSRAKARFEAIKTGIRKTL